MKIGLQLFSIRKIAEEKGLCAAFDLAKELGYDGVELAGFYGMTAAQVKEELDKRGLECAGLHESVKLILGNTEEEINIAKTLNAYSICIPACGKGDLDYWRERVSAIREVAPKFKEAGVMLGYHNHTTEFEGEGDVKPIDIIFGGDMLDYMFFEMDTRHVVHAGYDPVEYAMKYNRTPVLHARDTNGETDCAVGSGIVDFKAVIDFCKPEWVVVEIENPNGVEQDAADSVKYLKENFCK